MSRRKETAWDILNVIYDAGAAVYNHVKKDHDRAREHWKNAAYDGLAAGFSKLRHFDEAFEVVNGTIKGTHASRELAKVSSVSSKYSDVASPKMRVQASTGQRYLTDSE